MRPMILRSTNTVKPSKTSQYINLCQRHHAGWYCLVGAGWHSYIQPKMLPRSVGHQISGPAMRNLMRHDARQRTVAGEQCWRDECQTRVLHSSVRERRWQAKQVIAAPGIWRQQRLGGFEVILRFFKLPCCTLNDWSLGPHARACTNVLADQWSNNQSNQVRWDRYGLQRSCISHNRTYYRERERKYVRIEVVTYLLERKD
jgi:hypothetical protein